jgi:lysophospholipase L1-like esterase
MIKVLLNKIKLFYFSLFFIPVVVLAAPLSPSSLQLEALSQTSVALEWIDNSDNESGFKIFRDDELIATTGANVVSYIDDKLSPNTTYTYTVKATDSLTKIKTTKRAYQSSEPVTVSLEGMLGDEGDWVAIFPLGATTHWDNAVAWARTNAVVHGDVVVNLNIYTDEVVETLPPGAYDVRAFFNHTFTVEAIDTFTIVETMVRTNKTTFMDDENITVSLTGMSEDVLDWVGLYPVGSTNERENARSWKYTSGKAEENLTFNAIEAGSYEVRAFFGDSLKLESKVAFTVLAPDLSTKIFLIGDSTVHNDSEGEQGWGSRLSDYVVNHETTVINQARSGSSSKSYLNDSEMHHDWTTTKELMLQANKSNGAYLFIQFGHNDEKLDESLHTKTGRGNSYYNYLKSYVDQAREMGVIPVLVTSVERQYVNNRDHGLYPQTMRELAVDEGVILLDLEERSFTEFAQYDSDEALWAVFDHDDHTHFNPNGAHIVAGWVKELACSEDATLCSKF